LKKCIPTIGRVRPFPISVIERLDVLEAKIHSGLAILSSSWNVVFLTPQVEGYEVALCDIKQEWADGGKEKIAKGYARLVEKGKMTQETVDPEQMLLQCPVPWYLHQ